MATSAPAKIFFLGKKYPVSRIPNISSWISWHMTQNEYVHPFLGAYLKIVSSLRVSTLSFRKVNSVGDWVVLHTIHHAGSVMQDFRHPSSTLPRYFISRLCWLYLFHKRQNKHPVGEHSLPRQKDPILVKAPTR